MSIYNQIFDTYRIEQQKIKDAIKLLEKNSYIVMTKEDYSKLNNK
jgi:hypothetical protein